MVFFVVFYIVVDLLFKKMFGVGGIYYVLEGGWDEVIVYRNEGVVDVGLLVG